MSARLAVLLGCLWALACAACGDVASQGTSRDPARDVVLVQVAPGGGAPRLTDADGAAVPREGPELRASWAPAVSSDGVRLCYLGRDGAGDVGLYIALWGEAGAVRLHVDLGLDDQAAPAWLPDERIVFSARAGDGSRALWVADPAATGAVRITFGGTDATDPIALGDGRILYVGRVLEAPEAPRPALFTVHPDGTGVTLFHAATRATRYARPREGADGSVRFLADGEDGRLVVLDPRAPAEAGTVPGLRAPVATAEPLPDGSWIVLTRGAGAAGGLRLQADGAQTPWACGDAAGTVLDVRARGPWPRPQGHLSSIDLGDAHGRVLCIDARPEGQGAPVLVRLQAKDGVAWRTLGQGTTENDGSFFVEVPADTPLRLDVIDESGGVIVASHTPFWVRPHEIRGCVGCHSPADATPPNVQPVAVQRAAVPVARWHEQRRMP